MAGRPAQPMILGRRNCRCCTCWRIVATDFAQNSKGNKRSIDSVCKMCRNLLQEFRDGSMEERFKLVRRHLGIKTPKMSMSEREFIIAKRNYEIKEKKLQRKIENINAVGPPLRTHTGSDVLLPILPFRLWLLGYIKSSGETVQGFANRVGRDESEIRRWMTGISWVSDCKPMPIHSVTMGNVDDVLTRSGVGPFKLEELYPYIEE